MATCRQRARRQREGRPRCRPLTKLPLSNVDEVRERRDALGIGHRLTNDGEGGVIVLIEAT